MAFGAPFAQKTNDTFTTTTVDMQIGSTNNNALDAHFDDIAIDTGALPGPSASVGGPAVAQVAAISDPLIAATCASGFTFALGAVASAPLAQSGSATRTIRYGYDGLYRLTNAQESGATTATFAYTYDLAGNRTDGGRSYNAANQVVGYQYDAAGNLVNDGTRSYAYDAFSRLTQQGATAYQYNGDGTLVQAGTTRYTQDLAAPLTPKLNDGSADYLYGLSRLAAQTGVSRTWYSTDALGSVRQTLSDSGAVLTAAQYDPWGTLEAGASAPFGFTGELSDGGLTYLRARWYDGGRGSFVSVDPFDGIPEEPLSQHPYQYANRNPLTNVDPTGWVVITEETRLRALMAS